MSPIRKRDPIAKEAARLLGKHLKKNKITLNKFCVDNDFTYSSMHEFMVGSTRSNPPTWKIAEILKLTGHSITIVPNFEDY
jgi:hypothetical protein|tara:strand:- start:408 stop:650 length:243 start_codon:yes stop_codon:yes gene_type:complete